MRHARLAWLIWCASVIFARAGADAVRHLAQDTEPFPSTLRFCGTQSLPDVDDNLSGVAVDPEDGTLVLVINDPPELLRYDPLTFGACVLSSRRGIEHSACDTEGVAFLDGGVVAVSQEADLDDAPPGQQVIVFNASTFEPTSESYRLKRLDDDGGVKHNSGLEGVTFDVETQTFYAVREGKPAANMAVYSFARGDAVVGFGHDPDVDFSSVLGGGDLETMFDGSLTDLAGVSFVPHGHTGSPSLLLLSQETKTAALFALGSPTDSAATLVLELPGLADMRQPEGVVWDATRRRLWVVGEPNEVSLWVDAGDDASSCPAAFDPECDATRTPPAPPAPTPTSPSPARLNEVADKSCASACGDTRCGGNDWVEIFNPSTDRSVSLAGYVLSDSHGRDDADAYVFAADATLDAGAFAVLCKPADFSFGIGSRDAVSLWDADGLLVDTTGLMSGGGMEGNSYAREPDGMGDWTYTEVGGTTQGEPNAKRAGADQEVAATTARSARRVFVAVAASGVAMSVMGCWLIATHRSALMERIRNARGKYVELV